MIYLSKRLWNSIANGVVTARNLNIASVAMVTQMSISTSTCLIPNIQLATSYWILYIYIYLYLEHPVRNRFVNTRYGNQTWLTKICSLVRTIFKKRIWIQFTSEPGSIPESRCQYHNGEDNTSHQLSLPPCNLHRIESPNSVRWCPVMLLTLTPITRLIYIILYYTILYCIGLYYIVLYWIILYYIILYWIILYCIVLDYIILYYIGLYYIILYYIIYHIYIITYIIYYIIYIYIIYII